MATMGRRWLVWILGAVALTAGCGDVAGTDGFGTWTVPEHDHPPEVVRFDAR